METVELKVYSRTPEERVSYLRAEDLIPAVYYGKGVENKNLKVKYQDFRKVYMKSGGNMVVELFIDEKERIPVLITEMDRDPVSDKIIHVDFINVRMDQEVTTEIPLKYFGIAPAVKDLGGILVTRDDIEVRCLPKYLIQSIEISIEPLENFNTQICVKDLKINENITVLTDPDEVVAKVAPPMVEEQKTETVVEGAVPTEGAPAESGKEADSEGKK